MHVFFIKHYKLTESLTVQESGSDKQYIKLSKGELDPNIDADIRAYLKTTKPENYDLILHSPTNRTRESAQAIKEYLAKDIAVTETNLLRECIWNPELSGTRIQRFIDGTDLSSLKDTWNRIQELDRYLKSLTENRVLCITHSFFMQIVYLFYFGNFSTYEEIKYIDIKNSFQGDYLKGFTIDISKSIQ